MVPKGRLDPRVRLDLQGRRVYPGSDQRPHCLGFGHLPQVLAGQQHPLPSPPVTLRHGPSGACRVEHEAMDTAPSIAPPTPGIPPRVGALAAYGGVLAGTVGEPVGVPSI